VLLDAGPQCSDLFCTREVRAPHCLLPKVPQDGHWPVADASLGVLLLLCLIRMHHLESHARHMERRTDPSYLPSAALERALRRWGDLFKAGVLPQTTDGWLTFSSRLKEAFTQWA
jgi:hypothetical protein